MKAIKIIYCVFVMLFFSAGVQVMSLSTVQAVSGYSVLSSSNAERSAISVQALSYNTTLAYAAQLRAQDMIDNGYWSHTSPTGSGMGYFLSAAGYPVYTAGENLSRGYSDARSVVSAWMSSSGHRATILNANYNEMGIGFVSGLFAGEYTTIVVAYYAATGPVYAPPPTPLAPPVQALPVPQSRPAYVAPVIKQTRQVKQVKIAPIPEDPTPLTETPAEVVASSPYTQSFEKTPINLSTDIEKTPKKNFWSTFLYVIHYLQMFYIIKQSSLFAVAR